MVLPVTALAILGVAGWSRYMRSSMLEVLHQDYVRTARPRGCRARRVLYKHALRNALIPIVTLLGLSIPMLIAGAAITETIFTWPGLGSLYVEAVATLDYPVILALVMLGGIVRHHRQPAGRRAVRRRRPAHQVLGRPSIATVKHHDAVAPIAARRPWPLRRTRSTRSTSPRSGPTGSSSASASCSTAWRSSRWSSWPSSSPIAIVIPLADRRPLQGAEPRSRSSATVASRRRRSATTRSARTSSSA